MQLVIDIPEDEYNHIKRASEHYLIRYERMIKSGTPLPKGPGRLISADSLIKAIEEKAKRLNNIDTINGLCGAVALIFDAPTIIEADKDGEE